MSVTASVEVKPTPKEMAELLWNMCSDEQAEMFKHLFDAAGSEHKLMMQFMYVRDDCEERNDESLGAFQAMFSSCYKYMTL
ncbi:MAG: hypothetical protein JKX91_06365 [Rhizobiaceae bacterium]|nr:hypothetical protein [Rhizobiaceae bacterium]